MESTDDKAYLRPGTSEGFAGARNVSIFTLTDEEKSWKLPKYDWPEKLVYQTPAAHRIFTKESVMKEEEEKLVTKDDNHIVFIHPKAFAPTSGTSYKNESVFIRQEMPNIVEVQADKCGATEYSESFH